MIHDPVIYTYLCTSCNTIARVDHPFKEDWICEVCFALNKLYIPVDLKTRAFDTGATRDVDSQKLDYEGFISPIVLERFAEYMHKCRLRNIPVGKDIRQSDNWQKGMPLDSYMKSMLRHTMEAWLMHDGYVAQDEKHQVLDQEEVLCAILFNVQGYLYELLKVKHDRLGRSDTGKIPVSELRKSPSVNPQRPPVLDVSPEVDADATGDSTRVNSESFPCSDY